MSTITLHGSAGSPFVARVILQLEAKGLDYALTAAAPGTPEFLKLNPIGKMPVLEHDGMVLPESAVIMEYLEEVASEPSLLPGDAKARAKARLIARTVDLYCGGTLDLLFIANDPARAGTDTGPIRAGLDRGLNALEAFLEPGGWAVGNRLSLADCVVASWLFYARMVNRVGYDLTAGRPKLQAYIDFVAAQPMVESLWTRMDEAFRAFMARRAAAAQAAKA